MSIKSFLLKKSLQFKGVSTVDAEKIMEQLESNPGLADALKTLNDNKPVKELFEKIQKEIEEKQKAGLPDVYATMNVMSKYKTEIAKHREELMPLFELLQK